MWVAQRGQINAIQRAHGADSLHSRLTYPFATIEPNVGVVSVPDDRFEPLARLVKTKVIVPATVEFLDIAGLVRGASKGEGLGNQFLANIRETDTVVQVVRCLKTRA